MKRGVLLLIFLLIIPVSYGFLDRITGMAVCSKEYVPVCGIDGVTYGNSCSAGGVKVSHSGACVADELVILYKDPDTGILSFLKTFSADSGSELFSVDYMDTKDGNFAVTAYSPKDGIMALRADMASDDESLPKGKDYFIMHWNVSGDKVNSLGAFSGGNVTDTDIESVVGAGELIRINTINYSMRTRYGVIIEDPKAYAFNDKVSIKVPSDIVKATVRLDDKVKNSTRFVTLGMGESIKDSYSHRDFPSIKDSTLVYGNSTYHISEFVAIDNAPTMMIGSVSKDFRFGGDVYLELLPGTLVYRYFFVDPFSMDESQGLQLEILGQKMTVYAADASTGKVIIDYAKKLRPYYSGDPFVNEGGSDTKWAFDIALGQKMQIGVKNKKSYVTYDDEPVREKGCYSYPFDYFSICFANLTVSEYLGLSFELVPGNDFSDIYPGWGNVSAVRVSSGNVKGISMEVAGKSLGVREIYLFPAAKLADVGPAPQETMQAEGASEPNGEEVKEQAKAQKAGEKLKLNDVSRYLVYVLIGLALLLAMDIIYQRVNGKA